MAQRLVAAEEAHKTIAAGMRAADKRAADTQVVDMRAVDMRAVDMQAGRQAVGRLAGKSVEKNNNNISRVQREEKAEAAYGFW